MPGEGCVEDCPACCHPMSLHVEIKAGEAGSALSCDCTVINLCRKRTGARPSHSDVRSTTARSLLSGGRSPEPNKQRAVIHRNHKRRLLNIAILPRDNLLGKRAQVS